jgi:hypothetical protein
VTIIEKKHLAKFGYILGTKVAKINRNSSILLAIYRNSSLKSGDLIYSGGIKGKNNN